MIFLNGMNVELLWYNVPKAAMTSKQPAALVVLVTPITLAKTVSHDWKKLKCKVNNN